MKLCFVVEDCYRKDSMPLAVARQIAEWGHDVDILQPGRSVARVSGAEAQMRARRLGPQDRFGRSRTELGAGGSGLRPDRLPDDLVRLAARIGTIFGLDLYGVDVIEGPDGWMVVDVNDFPSFHWVPNRVRRVARSILRIAMRRGRSGRDHHHEHHDPPRGRQVPLR